VIKGETNVKSIRQKFNSGCTDVCAACPTKKDLKSPVLLDLEKEDESKKNTSD
jgi:hypothetical protein